MARLDARRSILNLQFSLIYIACASAAQVLAQNGNAGDDSACLAGFKSSVQDQRHLLSSWRTAHLAFPCSGSISFLKGVACDNSRVYSLVLPGSGLSGTLSSSLSSCSALSTLDLSSNDITGGIPSELAFLSNLVYLNLSANELLGSIPAELSNCTYLNALDLHDNQLTGSIPAELGSLIRLQEFDVSSNKLSGAIPSVISFSITGSPRFNISSFVGNKGLFGFPLPPSSNHGLSVLEIVGIGLASGALSLIVSFTAVCIWLRLSDHRLAAEEGKISELVTKR